MEENKSESKYSFEDIFNNVDNIKNGVFSILNKYGNEVSLGKIGTKGGDPGKRFINFTSSTGMNIAIEFKFNESILIALGAAFNHFSSGDKMFIYNNTEQQQSSTENLIEFTPGTSYSFNDIFDNYGKLNADISFYCTDQTNKNVELGKVDLEKFKPKSEGTMRDNTRRIYFILDSRRKMYAFEMIENNIPRINVSGDIISYISAFTPDDKRFIYDAPSMPGGRLRRIKKKSKKTRVKKLVLKTKSKRRRR